MYMHFGPRPKQIHSLPQHYTTQPSKPAAANARALPVTRTKFSHQALTGATISEQTSNVVHPRPPSSGTSKLRVESGKITTRATASPLVSSASPATVPQLPAKVIVLAPTHRGIQESSLGLFYPATKICVRNATGAVTANNCKLAAHDHYHVNKVSLNSDGLLNMSKQAKKALVRIIAKPTEARVKAFQRRLASSLAGAPDRHPTLLSQPVATTRLTYVTGSTAVQQTDGSAMSVNTRYRVRETRLPMADLLRENGKLVRSLAQALRTGTESDLAAFLRGAVHVAGNVEAIELLKHATSLNHDPFTSVFSLFGRTRIRDANAVMVGSGNSVRSTSNVRRPGAASSGLAALVDQLDRVLGAEKAPTAAIPASRTTAKPDIPPARSESYDDSKTRAQHRSRWSLPSTPRFDKTLDVDLGIGQSSPVRDDPDDIGTISF